MFECFTMDEAIGARMDYYFLLCFYIIHVRGAVESCNI
jgi:hypothetical protein